jgi:hypothetical protein
VSWYHPHATRSLAFVLDSVAPPDDAVIDVGAGTSPLVGELAALGFRDLTVLDVAGAVAVGGWLVVGAFAEDGPDHCSGLPVQRHSRESLTDAFGPAFAPVDFDHEDHVTPSGAVQRFLYGRFRRVGSG